MTELLAQSNTQQGSMDQTEVLNNFLSSVGEEVEDAEEGMYWLVVAPMYIEKQIIFFFSKKEKDKD